MAQLFINNFEATLLAAVKASPTSGSPNTELDYGILRISDAYTSSLPALTGGNFYIMTLLKRTGTVESNYEIIKVTALDTGTVGELRLTVSRAQEGTTAKAFASGDYVSLRMTAGSLGQYMQGANNLSEVANAATARTNLGLGTAATKDFPATGNASTTQVVVGTDTRLSDSRPASDVSAWAKAATKPTYTATEVGAPSGSGTSTGINTGDQTITLTGGVTGSGTGTITAVVQTNANMTGDVTSVGNATTIAAGAVTLAKMANMATQQLLGRNTAGTGSPEVLAPTTVKTMLALAKADVGLGNVDNTSDLNKPVSTAQSAADAAVQSAAATDATTKANAAAAASAPIAHVGAGGTAHAAVTTTVAGFMSAADKTKLDGIAAGATANTGTVTGVTGTAPVVSSGGTAPVISMAAANATTNGYMTSTYAAKLDGIAAGATANTGTVTGVTATAPVVSSGGTAPVISMAAANSTTNGYMTSTYAAKLDGIAAGATNYTHPANHPPSIITQDASNRFVTDVQISAWNAKQDASTAINTTNIGSQSVTYATSAGSAGSATSATTSTNIAGGGAGQLPYQSAAGSTAMLAAGTAGQILQSNGAAAPSWVTPAPAGVTSVNGQTGAVVTTDLGGIGSVLLCFYQGTTPIQQGATIAGSSLYRITSVTSQAAGNGALIVSSNWPTQTTTYYQTLEQIQISGSAGMNLSEIPTMAPLTGTWRALAPCATSLIGAYNGCTMSYVSFFFGTHYVRIS